MSKNVLSQVLAVPDVEYHALIEDEEFDLSRDPEELLIELEALNAAANVVEGRGEASETRNFIQIVLDGRPHPTCLEDHLIVSAMRRITGQTILPPVVEAANNWSSHVTQTVVRAWTDLMIGQAETAIDHIKKMRDEQHNSEHVRGSSGAINLMALYFWAGAVEALAGKRLQDARRLWKRAMEVGSSFGTPSSMLVQWTYVASFYPV